MSSFDIGKMILGNLNLAKLFRTSYSTYIEIEKNFIDELREFDYFNNIKVDNKSKNFINNFKKNFFTLLMISILENSGVTKQRLIKYGKIIFCLRAIITCTDNMIDNEEKGVLFIENLENDIVKNTMLLMTAQQIMGKNLRELGDIDEKVYRHLLNKIFSVAKSEGLRLRNIYDEYPNPKKIESEIHSGIGGELLQLALTAPNLLEENSEKLKGFNTGLYNIGMALQALDDLCDIQEDFEANQVNLAISHFSHKLDLSENEIPNELITINLEKKYNQVYSDYINRSIDTALAGFDKFASLDYPINRKDSLILIKLLFKLRGLGDMFDLSKYASKKTFKV